MPLSPEFNPIAPTLMENGQVLVIKSATKSDEGNYKCVIEKDGTEMAERKITLTVAGMFSIIIFFSLVFIFI